MSTPPTQPAPTHAYIRQPLSDVNARAVLVIVLAGAFSVLDIVLLTVAYHYQSARAELDRQVVRASYTELRDYRAAQDAKLHSFGPSPNLPGAYTIPIERAMELYLQTLTPAHAKEAP